MDIILIGVAMGLIIVFGQLIFARWGGGYARRMGDEYWKHINRSDVPEDEHYK